MQEFSVRNDCPCGSTIGPVLSQNLGVRAVDLGMPQVHTAHTIYTQSCYCILTIYYTIYIYTMCMSTWYTHHTYTHTHTLVALMYTNHILLHIYTRCMCQCICQQLSMHSIREMMGAADLTYAHRLFTHFLRDFRRLDTQLKFPTDKE